VLPSLTRRLRIKLLSAGIEVLVVDRGLKPRASKPQMIPHQPDTHASDWRASLQLLRMWLAEQKLGRTEVDLILSDHYTRYHVVPWHEEVVTGAEIVALGRACFADGFGPVADGWDVQIDLPEFGRPGIACAVERALLEELGMIFSEHRMRLCSLTPAFMDVFNAHRKQFGHTVLLAVIDDRRCVLASVKDGQWHSIRSVSCASDDGTEVSVMLEREILLQGLPSEVPRHVHVLKTEGAVCVR